MKKRNKINKYPKKVELDDINCKEVVIKLKKAFPLSEMLFVWKGGILTGKASVV